jgi:hypothetical protein
MAIPATAFEKQSCVVAADAIAGLDERDDQDDERTFAPL